MPNRLAGAAGAVALCLLFAGVYVHHHGKSELFQDDSLQEARMQALNELSANKITPQLYAVENAYARGYAQGENVAEEHAHHAPALLAAASNWRKMMLERLQAQQESEKTDDARKEELAARRVALALKAADESEPAAWKHWSPKLLVENTRMRLAQAAEQASEPGAYRKFAKLHQEIGGVQGRMQLAMREPSVPMVEGKLQLAKLAEKAAWAKDGLKLEQRQELAMQAERASEPQALAMTERRVSYDAHKELAMQADKESEQHTLALAEMQATDDARKRMAEARLESMHRAMRNDYTQQLSQMQQEQAHAEQEAALLFHFCAKEFPAAVGLRKFCFEKLSSAPKGNGVDTPEEERDPQPQEFTGSTLEGAIAKAHKAGERGMPKYAVFHEKDGREEAFKLVPVVPGARVPADAEGFVNVPEVASLRQERPRIDKSFQAENLRQAGEAMRMHVRGGAEAPVRINAPTLQGAIAEAHAMGLKGEPNYVVYHPAEGTPEVFKLLDKEH